MTTGSSAPLSVLPPERRDIEARLLHEIGQRMRHALRSRVITTIELARVKRIELELEWPVQDRLQGAIGQSERIESLLIEDQSAASDVLDDEAVGDAGTLREGRRPQRRARDPMRATKVPARIASQVMSLRHPTLMRATGRSDRRFMTPRPAAGDGRASERPS
jgi:hypothetical protein